MTTKSKHLHRLHVGLVNACTALNLVLGLVVVIATTMEKQQFAAWCLLACVVLDAADGFLARRWRVSSEFGAQFDSLADMSSFIIAGAVVAFFWFRPDLPLIWMGSAACLYVLSGAIRLARFNCSVAPGDGEFQGLPTTAVAALIAVTYLTYPELNSHWGVALLVMLSFLMVSVFPYPKYYKLIRMPVWCWALLAVGGIVDFQRTTWLCAVLYLLSGPYRWLRRRLAPTPTPVPVAVSAGE